MARHATTRDYERAGDAMRITCAHCPYIVVLLPPLIARSFPRPVTIAALEPRMRCRQCGARGARITVEVPLPLPDGRR